MTPHRENTIGAIGVAMYVAGCALAVAAFACAALAQSGGQVAEARAALAASLKDPASAQYRNVRAKSVVNMRGEPIQVVCGEVNAKNSYGAFSGFAPWIYLASTRSAYLLGADQDIATVAMLKSYC